MTIDSTNIGKNLKTYREIVGYTQEEFAALCGISRQSLHKHETGKSKPTSETLANYAKTLGISVTDLTNNIHPKAWNFQVFDRIVWECQGND